jgi:AraC-like DNA-binding protein
MLKPLRMTNIKPYSKYVLDAVKSIKKHIDADPFEYKTAAALLEQVCSPNRSAVEKVFKKVHGCGIKVYQLSKRLEASKKFLEEGMSKKMIASKCFYRSQSAYAAAFKKEFGMTPTDWQLLYSV